MSEKDGLPELDGMLSKEYSPSEWLRYYKNHWTRELVARTIDVEQARAEAANNPNELLDDDGSRPGRQLPPIKAIHRLGKRKVMLDMAVQILATIGTIQAKGEGLPALWSPEATKVAENEVPKLVRYVVQPGNAITHLGLQKMAGAEIDLDPDAEDTKSVLAQGAIILKSDLEKQVAYVVPADKKAAIGDTIYGPGEVIKLDPEADVTKKLLEAGDIVLQAAPAAQPSESVPAAPVTGQGDKKPDDSAGV